MGSRGQFRNKEILGGLFYEGQRRHSQVEHLFAVTSDDNDSALGFQELFDISSTEKPVCNEFDWDSETDSEIVESENETEESVNTFDDEVDDDDNNDNCNFNEEFSVSSTTYTEVKNYFQKMHECRICCLLARDEAGFLNNELKPLPK
ncbi:hypothetical protein Aperf_G00000002512 [Anoplocephala perfoliata]